MPHRVTLWQGGRTGTHRQTHLAISSAPESSDVYLCDFNACFSYKRKAFPTGAGRMLIESRPPRSCGMRFLLQVSGLALRSSVAITVSRRSESFHTVLRRCNDKCVVWRPWSRVLATVLSALSLDYFFIAPIHSITLDWQSFFAPRRILGGSARDQLSDYGAKTRGRGAAQSARRVRRTSPRTDRRVGSKPTHRCGPRSSSASEPNRTLGRPAGDGASGTTCRPGTHDRNHRA